MRLLREGRMLRLMGKHYEVAYAIIGICGLEAEIEFPSDWHEDRQVWIRIGLGICRIAVSFPWKWTVPDEGQCSGPCYGFQFHSDLLFIRYGKDRGGRDDPSIAIHMPWHWRHREHKILTEPEIHPYHYTLKSGIIQERTATINVESRLWTRWWIPMRLFKKTIDVNFNDQVGERTGSWKGGTLGCGYDMLPDETPLQTLRRMERERKF